VCCLAVSQPAARGAVGEMPVRTKEGWKSRYQIEKQDKAWKKARKTLVNMIGQDNLKNSQLIKERAMTIFKDMDADQNGKIDTDELKAAMAKLGVELKASEVKDMMTEADEDGDEHIDPDEFVNLCLAEVERYLRRSSTCAVM